MATPEVREQIAHVFRRLGFGPAPGQVDAWEDDGPEALIESLLAAEVEPARTDKDLFAGFEQYLGGDDEYAFTEAMVLHMLTTFMRGVHPLHERMSWYWHTHFTSSLERASGTMLWRQHQLVRRHALGHFPTLLREITTDAAMLVYLDGAESRGAEPNENHARELLELFALGRGNYSEDDVRAGARIMAGWWVDWETDETGFDPERAYTKPVTFLGVRRRWTLDAFIEHVCAQPACAAHVVDRLHSHLVGPDLSDVRRAELAAVFVESGLEIRPLIAAMVRHPDFLASVRSRARQPVEWLLGARAALGFDTPVDDDQLWWTDVLGQMPFEPPNVAGWPLDDRWASASQIISRTSALFDWELPEAVWDQVEPTADAVLARCGIHDPSDTTRAALKAIEADVSEYDGLLELLFASALISPEFSLL